MKWDGSIVYGFIYILLSVSVCVCLYFRINLSIYSHICLYVVICYTFVSWFCNKKRTDLTYKTSLNWVTSLFRYTLPMNKFLDSQHFFYNLLSLHTNITNKCMKADEIFHQLKYLFIYFYFVFHSHIWIWLEQVYKMKYKFVYET